MAMYSNDPRVCRLNTILKESEERSVTSFAKRIGVAQSTTRNYVLGERMPDSDFCHKVINAFPEFNYLWLAEGAGEKYNSDMVDVNPDGHVEEPGNSIRKMEEMYKTIITSLQETINSLKGQCKSQQEQLEMMKEMMKMNKGSE